MKSALETIFIDTVEDKSRGRTMVEKKKKKKTFTINKRWCRAVIAGCTR